MLPSYSELFCSRPQFETARREHGPEGVDSAVPNGTKIVILTINGYNDNHKLIASSAEAPANIAAIKRKITARGIRLIDAMGLYNSVMKQPGMFLGDGLHLSIEGNKKLATILAGMLK